MWDWGVHYLHPSWQMSSSVAVLLSLAALVLRRWHPDAARARSFAREFAVVTALHAFWIVLGVRLRTHTAGAIHRAEQLQKIESRLHLPSELAIQQAALPHLWLVKAMNVYYASAHLQGMIVFLIWIWWRHRDSFRSVRNTVAVTTLICLLIQMIPVAPPRLIPGSGFTDTGLQLGQSVYGSYDQGLPTQLTAMPSFHVTWAFIVAWYVVRLGRGPLRWLGVVHLMLTVLVVVGTANHWWLDGIVGILLALLVLAVQSRFVRPDLARPIGDREAPAVDPQPA